MKRTSVKLPSVEDRVELAILRIALLITSLDGHIDDSEYEFFGQLVYNAHIAAGMDILDVISQTRASAESLAALARKSKSNKAVLKALFDILDSFCPWDELAEEPVLIRRAFAIWTAMAMADGKYCDVERLAIRMLQRRINSIPRIRDSFLDDVEEHVGKLKSIKTSIERTASVSKKIKLRAESQKILADMDVF